ncbi:trans-golgi network integral membrane protein tgn38 [Anaeramoeba flamelloides]|uniref:Trans-golgi network integral membrane protein tgn38 n=1 Tax=Anaeramoeba flamelloides TaxID=1746091 RepID=A0AAV7ZC52_9EUKA|nr:trans-golgi network integral membrane protein tgn38 [Anaeramoeba flamelloides]
MSLEKKKKNETNQEDSQNGKSSKSPQKTKKEQNSNNGEQKVNKKNKKKKNQVRKKKKKKTGNKKKNEKKNTHDDENENKKRNKKKNKNKNKNKNKSKKKTKKLNTSKSTKSNTQNNTNASDSTQSGNQKKEQELTDDGSNKKEEQKKQNTKKDTNNNKAKKKNEKGKEKEKDKNKEKEKNKEEDKDKKREKEKEKEKKREKGKEKEEGSQSLESSQKISKKKKIKKKNKNKNKKKAKKKNKVKNKNKNRVGEKRNTNNKDEENNLGYTIVRVLRDKENNIKNENRPNLLKILKQLNQKPISVFFTPQDDNKIQKDSHNFVESYLTTIDNRVPSLDSKMFFEKHNLYYKFKVNFLGDGSGSGSGSGSSEPTPSQNYNKSRRKSKSRITFRASQSSLRSFFRGFNGVDPEKQVKSIVDQIRNLGKEIKVIEDAYLNKIAVQRDQLSQKLKKIDRKILELNGEFDSSRSISKDNESQNGGGEGQDDNNNASVDGVDGSNGIKGSNKITKEEKGGENEPEKENDENQGMGNKQLEKKKALKNLDYYNQRINEIFVLDQHYEVIESNLRTRYKITMRQIREKREILRNLKKEIHKSNQIKNEKKNRKIRRLRMKKIRNKKKKKTKVKRGQFKYPFISGIVDECLQVAMNKINFAEKVADPVVKMERGQIQCIMEVVNAIIMEDAHRAKELLTGISERIKSEEPWENWEIEEIKENDDNKKNRNEAIPPPPPMLQIPEFKVNTAVKENTKNKTVKPKLKITKLQKQNSITSTGFLNAKTKLKKVSSISEEQQRISMRRGSLLDLINSGLQQKFRRANIWNNDDDSQNSDSSESSDYSDEFD